MNELILVTIPVIGSLAGVWIGDNINKKNAKEINERNIVAEIISKSRVEWIQEVRKLFVAFTASAQKLSLINLKMNLKTGNTTMDDVAEYSEALSEFKGFYSNIYLYFSIEDSDNANVHKWAKKLYDETVQIDSEKVEKSKDSNNTEKEIQNYLENVRENEKELLQEVNKYLNIQWRRSKSLDIGNTSIEMNQKKLKSSKVIFKRNHKKEKPYHIINMDDYK